MTCSASSARLATSTDSILRNAVVRASSVVHGDSGAELADDLSKRFARPITGARYLNRATRLAVLAVDRLGLDYCASPSEARQLGVVAATFGAHFENSCEQLTELLVKERPLVSPMLGPNSIPSSVSSCLSIYLNAQAFTLSFCDAGTAGLESLAFGSRAISTGRARRVVVVGVESRSPAIETSLFGDSHGSNPPDEAYALLLEAGQNQTAHGSGQRLSFVAQSRRFNYEPRADLRRLNLQRCLADMAERARLADVPVDLFLGDLGLVRKYWEPNELVSVAAGCRDAHVLDNQSCHFGLQCTAGLAHVAALHASLVSGQPPEGVTSLRRGERAWNELRGAIIVNDSNDGTIACALLRVDCQGGT